MIYLLIIVSYLSDHMHYCISVNCSNENQDIIIWPKSFQQIQQCAILNSLNADAYMPQTMSFFYSKKQHVPIPKYGCVVFPSDTLHAGAPNLSQDPLFRGFCVLQRSKNLGFDENVTHKRYDEVHYINQEELFR